ncbi:MAG: tetratricopeptide repeat protein [Myxococcales bacterium]|nr:tetratricopeptide repeat protein [Myxococcales bacterium]
MGLFSSKPKWAKYLKKAKRAERAGLWADAYYLFEATLNENPPEDEVREMRALFEKCAGKLVEEHSHIAEVLVEQGHPEGAKERYEMVLRFAQTDEQRDRAKAAIDALGVDAPVSSESDEDSDEPPRAPVSFELITGALSDERADRYYALGDEFREAVVAAQSGRPEEAIAFFEERANSDDAAILFEYGQALHGLGRYSEAVDVFLRAETSDPEWLDIHVAMAQACWRCERFQEALEALERALEVDEKHPLAGAMLCRSALLAGDAEYALELVDQRLSVDSNDATNHILRGQALEALDRLDAAVDSYENAVKISWRLNSDTRRISLDRNAAVAAITLYLRKNDELERAEELARVCQASVPVKEQWRYVILQSDILRRAGQHDDADELLRKVRSHVPESSRFAHLRIADLLGEQDQVESILADMDEEQGAEWLRRKAESDELLGRGEAASTAA